jgi:hypothetical protein
MRLLRLLLLGLLCLADCTAPEPTTTHRHTTGRKASIEVVGICGTCLKCGKDFTAQPDENGVIALTPLCPSCQRAQK